MLLKFGADPNAEPINGRSPFAEAVVQGRSYAFQLLVRSGACAQGVQLCKYASNAVEASVTKFLDHLPSFTWWDQDLPVEKLLKTRCRELKAELEGEAEEGIQVEEKRRKVGLLENLQIAAPLLAEDEELEVLASYDFFLRQLGCAPESSQLVHKQPAIAGHFLSFPIVKELGLGGDDGKACSMALSAKYLATGSTDSKGNKVQVYDLEVFHIVKELEEANGEVSSIIFSDRYLATVSEDKKVRVYDWKDFRMVKEMGEDEESVKLIALSDKYIATGSHEGKVRVYDLKDFCMVKELLGNVDFRAELDAGEFITIMFSNKYLLIATSYNVWAYDQEDFQCLKAMTGSCVAISDQYLATGAGSTVLVYELQDLHEVKEVKELSTKSYVLSIACSDKYLATVNKDQKVRLYDLRDFALIKVLIEDFVYYRNPIRPLLAFSDKYLAVATGSKKVSLYDLHSETDDHLSMSKSSLDTLQSWEKVRRQPEDWQRRSFFEKIWREIHGEPREY